MQEKQTTAAGEKKDFTLGGTSIVFYGGAERKGGEKNTSSLGSRLSALDSLCVHMGKSARAEEHRASIDTDARLYIYEKKVMRLEVIEQTLNDGDGDGVGAVSYYCLLSAH